MKKLFFSSRLTLLWYIFYLFCQGPPLQAEKILVLRSSVEEFSQVLSGFKNELEEDYTIVDKTIDVDESYISIFRTINNEDPDLLVVIDEQAIDVALKYSKAHNEELPCVALGLNLKKVIGKYKNFCGISYEVPLFQMATNFRFASQDKVKKILVPFRMSQHLEMVWNAKKQLRKEGINLVGLNVEKDGKDKEEILNTLKEELQQKLKEEKFDAIWALSDSDLLNDESLKKIWLPASKKGVPILGGIKKFANKDMDFCSFVSSPDHQQLGMQLSQLVTGILEDGEKPQRLSVENVIAVQSVINLSKLDSIKKKVHSDRLQDLDIVR